jgi:hypothetical protein
VTINSQLAAAAADLGRAAPQLVEKINGQLGDAVAGLVRACTQLVEQYGRDVLPQLLAAVRENTFAVRSCPVCRTRYAVRIVEERAVTCCGFELPTECDDVVAGDAVYHPTEDQFAEAPAIVEHKGG